MPLYDPSEHEPLTATGWSADRAREAIGWIVDEAVDAHADGVHWGAGLSFWTGAAGMLWALDRLGAELGEAGISTLQDDSLRGAGLMQGASGVLLASRRLAPSAETDDRLAALVAGNARNPSHELFDGAPGTMLAALQVYEATGDERWAAL